MPLEAQKLTPPLSRQSFMPFNVQKNLLQKALVNRTIYICSDSQAALSALSSETKLVEDYWKILDDLSNLNQVILHWVLGHTGIDGNGRADKLPKLSQFGL